MKRCNLWWILILAVIVIIIWGSQSSDKKSEGFNILGALAPYKDDLYKCQKECGREDPSKRLESSGNFSCSQYCQSYFTGLARAGLPPSPKKPETCETRCSKGPYGKNSIAKNKCISMCNCHSEVKEWCRELQSPYSTLDARESMKQCIATQMVNCNSVGWSWMKHG